MEVIVKVVFIDSDEVVLTLNLIIRLFPDDIVEMGGIIGDGRSSQQTMTEGIVELMGGMHLFTHQHIVGIAREDESFGIEL